MLKRFLSAAFTFACFCLPAIEARAGTLDLRHMKPRFDPRACDPLKYVPGRHGLAVELDGRSQSIEIPHDDRLKPAAGLTLAAWIRPRETPDRWAEIYRKDDGRARQLLALGGGDGGYALWFGFGAGGEYRELGAPLDPQALLDGRWHHVAASFDGRAVRFYLDGRLLREQELAGRLDRTGTESAFIGSLRGTGEFFPGGIDDVRLYARGLAPEEVAALAAGRLDVAGEDLAGWWPLDGDRRNAARLWEGPRAFEPELRVVIAGGTFAEDAGRWGFLEAVLLRSAPGRKIAARNLARAGDDTAGNAWFDFGPAGRRPSAWRRPDARSAEFGYRRRHELICNARPDVLILAFGREAAWDDAGPERFIAGLSRLLADLEPLGARIVLLAPPPLPKGPPPMPDPSRANARLAEAAKRMARLAGERGHLFADLFSALRPALEGPGAGELTENGYALSRAGHALAARAVEEALGLRGDPWRVELDAEGTVAAASGARLDGVAPAARGVRFESTGVTVPLPRIPHRSEPRLLRVRGLRPGLYTLYADGVRIAGAPAEKWNEGVDLRTAPEYADGARLLDAIAERNRLTIERLRPQNETYILLFRRHERGDLARELARYDRLIEEADAEIHRLLAPRTHVYELVREDDDPEHEVPRRIPPADVEAELASFRLPEGFEISLFAREPMVRKPIDMNWDARGRLWVAGSTTYPHLVPGHKPRDRIVILEDRDRDGRADRWTVFAEGLLFPHSVLPWRNGAYVTAARELLWLEDTDGDDRADRRRVLLSGFGVADIHHAVHRLRFGPEGAVYFLQSIYINSDIDTPYGPRRLRASGTWRFEPESMRLEVFSRGLVNPWGIAFDEWGRSFETDGAGGGGIAYVFPGAAFTTADGARRTLPSLNPGHPKACGLEVLSGRHLPPSWRGTLVTHDFRAHRVNRYRLGETGSGFTSTPLEDVVVSTHGAFRPVDVKMGPDGAIYIADWYNPVIDHGEVNFHHPYRDREHGRIWRITARGRPFVEPPDLVNAGVPELLEALKAPEGWTRGQARRRLAEKGAAAVLPELQKWVRSLPAGDPASEHHRLEALWVTEWLGVLDKDLLASVLASPEPRARAAAVRVLSYHLDDHPRALDLLERAALDDDPRVRLEAACALRLSPTRRAAEAAARILDQPLDRDLDYAVWLALRELAPVWVPALEAGEVVFGGDPHRLAYALEAVGGAAVLRPLRDLVRGGRVPEGRAGKLLELLARFGDAADAMLVLERALEALEKSPARAARLLEALAAGRAGAPAEAGAKALAFLEHPDADVRRAACALLGRWKAAGARDRLAELVEEAGDVETSLAAARALAALGDAESLARLDALARAEKPWRVRAASVVARAAAGRAPPEEVGALLEAAGEEADEALLRELAAAFLGRKGGAEELAAALAGREVGPRAASILLGVVRGAGVRFEELEETLARTARPLAQRFGPQERRALLERAAREGDPARGESVFRREDLGCLRCHSVAGAGGRVGPPLDGIGAAAAPEYLLESLLDPNARIKEGYQTTVVVRSDGRVVTGRLERRGADRLYLVTSDDVLLEIPASEVVAATPGDASLMPQGLPEKLEGRDLADLLAFLSALGRDPRYRPGARRFVRAWELVPLETAAEGLEEALRAAAGRRGRRFWATTAGTLPAAELRAAAGGRFALLRAELPAQGAGETGIIVSDCTGLRFFVEGREVPCSPRVRLGTGRAFAVLVDLEARRSDIAVEVVAPDGAEASAGGR